MFQQNILPSLCKCYTENKEKRHGDRNKMGDLETGGGT